jgi:threonine dehydrogenase-like Zn-dependent dehydrogenase
MKALKNFGPHDLRIVELPDPQPRPGAALICVRASGICGSDKWYWTTGPTDFIAGHEVAGEVVAVGDGVMALAPGDRVAVNNVVGCGACPACAAGAFTRCPNRTGNDVNDGFCEYVVAPVRNCLILDPAVDYVAGCLAFDQWGTPYAAVERGGVVAADTVAVTGLGPIGLGAVKCAALRGARVVALDPVAYRREMALGLGAAAALDPTAADAAGALKDVTGGGPTVAVECSGNGKAYGLLLAALRPKGRLVSVGEHAEFTFHPSDDVIRKNLSILGSWYSTMPQGAAVQRLMVQGALPAKALVTHTVTLEEAPSAFARAVEMADGVVKTVILMPA